MFKYCNYFYGVDITDVVCNLLLERGAEIHNVLLVYIHFLRLLEHKNDVGNCHQYCGDLLRCEDFDVC